MESTFTRTVSTEKSDFLGFLYHKKMINMTFEFDEFDELRSCRTFKAVSDTLIYTSIVVIFVHGWSFKRYLSMDCAVLMQI